MDIRETIGDAVSSLQVKTKEASPWTKWGWYILGASLGLLLVGFLVLESLHNSRKAAKALHARDVLLEKQAIAKLRQVVTVSEKKKIRLITKAEKHQNKADAKFAENTVLTEKVERNKKIINKLKDWDDVKKRIKYPPHS